MKECPKCHELVGDAVTRCFNCQYDFIKKRVLSSSELTSQREAEMQNSQNYLKELEQLESQKVIQIQKNAKYEYEVVIVDDLSNGCINNLELTHRLDEYSREGWRLHSVINNEIGKNATSSSVGGIGFGTNATINQTVLIFERCIKREEV